MSGPHHLGAFRLDAVLASGGMAEVWRGVHRSSGEAVAVKLMRTDQRNQALWQSAFRAEVRAMARLHHPSVVRIHDYGQVPDDPPSVWMPGTPWLAMELVPGGTLSERRPQGWTAISAVLAQLLDALAAAHAHDVIHRDIKPANVLVAADRTVKLTDFGIAHALDRADLAESSTLDGGTPPFMAPEQFEGKLADTGPWTDLYALGCLAWWMVCGRPPYGKHDNWLRAAMAHTEQPIPPLRPRIEVPDGLEGWLQRLLAKDPTQRYRQAADASWALARLLPVTDDGDVDADPEDQPTRIRPTATLPWRPRSPLPTTEAPTQLLPRIPTADGPTGVLSRQEAPPIPDDWDDRLAELTDPLGGAGLGLFGLREFPLVGRQAERDRLWQVLRRAESTGRPQLVLLEGPAGSGKSRVAEWFVRRTRTLGVMHWSHATHGVPPGPGDGLGPMVRRDLALGGLDRNEALARIRRLLLEHGLRQGDEVDALGAIAAPPSEEALASGARTVRFSSPVERYALISRHLRRKAEGRIPGLWLDDVQWGLESLQLSRWLMERHDGPLVVVATVRTDTLSQRRAEARAVERLRAHDRATPIEVGPLSEAAQAELLERWLGLSTALAHRVRERTDGNPLFAVQLVGGWVDRDLLVTGPGGFSLRPGSLDEIPDDLHAIWLARVDRVVSEGPPSWRPALELAAALGMEIHVPEWLAICDATGLARPEGLVDGLVRAKLARSFGRDTWRFEHGMLRESIERDARERARWTAHNLACVAWFREHGGPGRVGRHLFAADRWEEATGPLLADTNATLLSAHLRRAEASLELAARALDLIEAPDDDPRRTRVLLARCRVFQDRGELDNAHDTAEQALSLARSGGDREVEGHALLRLGELYRDRPDVDRARARFAEAHHAFAASGDARGQAHSLHELGRVAMFAGDFDEARDLHRRAKEGFESLENPNDSGIANCHRALGELEIRREVDLEAAKVHFHEANRRYRALGMRFGEVAGLNGLAEIARLTGDLEAAEAGYARAVQLSDAMGHDGGDIMRINLAITGLLRADPSSCDPLGPVRDRMARHERTGLVGFIDVLRLVGRGLEGRFDGWAELATSAGQALQQAGLIDRDAARFAQQAGDLASAAGHPDLAESAWTIARAQWGALGEDAAATSVGRVP